MGKLRSDETREHGADKHPVANTLIKPSRLRCFGIRVNRVVVFNHFAEFYDFLRLDDDLLGASRPNTIDCVHFELIVKNPTVGSTMHVKLNRGKGEGKTKKYHVGSIKSSGLAFTDTSTFS